MLLFDKTSCIPIYLENDNPYVRLALEDVRQDFCRVSSARHLPALLEEESGFAIVVEKNTLPSSEAITDESFLIVREGAQIRIRANGYLGTMWALYTFSEKVLGVDPCYLFNVGYLSKSCRRCWDGSKRRFQFFYGSRHSSYWCGFWYDSSI